MIRKSFIFLDKIGLKTEQGIWNQGIRDWDDFLDAKKVKGISKKAKIFHDLRISTFRRRLNEEDIEFLSAVMPKSEHWRMYRHFRDDAAFLDIETGHQGDITVIGLYDSYSTKTMIKGYNLDRHLLKKELKKHKMLVTFNGRAFDMPAIRRYFDISPGLIHMDLMHVCRRIGLTGGLKSIEKKLGISRPESIKHVKGHDAAELWRCWKATGDREFLEMLITYNEEDTINLKAIADFSVPGLEKKLLNPSQTRP